MLMMMMITFLYALRLHLPVMYTRLLFEKKLNDVVGSEPNGCMYVA